MESENKDKKNDVSNKFLNKSNNKDNKNDTNMKNSSIFSTIKQELNIAFSSLAESVVILFITLAFFSFINKVIYTIPFASILNSLLGATLAGFIALRMAHKKNASFIVMVSAFLIATITSKSVMINPNGVLVLKAGNLITAVLMAYLTIRAASYLEKILKTYKALFVLFLVSFFIIPLGLFLNNYFDLITIYLGELTIYLITLRPFLMGGFIGVIFALVICSPLSSVALAFIVGITGVAAGSASMGITTIAFTLFVMALYNNGISKSIMLLLGGPKMMLQNISYKPQILTIGIIFCFILSGISAVYGFSNTTIGAGFGIVTGLGLLEALQANSSYLFVVLFMLILPMLLGFIAHYISLKLKIYNKDDTKININI